MPSAIRPNSNQQPMNTQTQPGREINPLPYRDTSFSRLEPASGACFLAVTTVSNRLHSRLEFRSFGTSEKPGRGILGRRSANCEPNREMLPLPASVPGIFICSSNRFARRPYRLGGFRVIGRLRIASPALRNCRLLDPVYRGINQGSMVLVEYPNERLRPSRSRSAASPQPQRPDRRKRSA